MINKYGTDVALVSNYNTFQFSGLLKDLCRTYGVESTDFVNKLNKKITGEVMENLGIGTKPENMGKDKDAGPENSDDEQMALAEVTGNFENLKEYSHTFKAFIEDEKYQKINFDFRRLLGKIKHIGKHAAGVVISDNLIDNQSIITLNDSRQTSLSEGTQERLLSDYGFVKIDILGLSTLSVLHNCLKIIEKDRTKTAAQMYELIHPDKINLEDPLVFKKIFNSFNMLGIFQFETDSMKHMVKRTNPTCFEDLIAMNALFRPGPLASGMAFQYGDRKKGLIQSDYYNHEIPKRILNLTHGIIAYQEQVMMLGNQLGKFSMDETNMLRKLLMKMKKSELKNNPKLIEAKDRFFKGAAENGMKEQDIIDIWEDMVSFAKYSFNRAHSVGYAMIAYQCAWLKTYHPLAFYCALLQNEDAENFEKIVSESKNLGIDILPVDINNSENTFAIKNGKIYFGFSNLTGCGDKATSAMMHSRANSQFKGFADFLLRDDMEWRHVNKKVVETLIHVGVFDFGKDQRNLLLLIYSKFSEKRAKYQKKEDKWSLENRQKILKEVYNEALSEMENLPTDEETKMNWELEHYKFNIQYSPFNIGDRKVKLEKILSSGRVGSFSDDSQYWVALFKEIKRFKDKNGRDMCFIDLVDHQGRKEKGVIFASKYKADLIQSGEIYLIGGSKDSNILINKFQNIKEF